MFLNLPSISHWDIIQTTAVLQLLPGPLTQSQKSFDSHGRKLSLLFSSIGYCVAGITGARTIPHFFFLLNIMFYLFFIHLFLSIQDSTNHIFDNIMLNFTGSRCVFEYIYQKPIINMYSFTHTIIYYLLYDLRI